MIERLHCISVGRRGDDFEQITAEASETEHVEAVRVATCARRESYYVNPSPQFRELSAARRPPQRHESDSLVLGRHVTRRYWGVDAIEHLFRVTAGLESPILGEPQILGQMRDAYLAASEAGEVGPILDAAFRAAIRTSRRVRSETPLGQIPASYASLACDALNAQTRTPRRVAVVGSGTLAREIGSRLFEGGHTLLTFVSRHLRRATALAVELGGRAVELNELQSVLLDADAVVTCTSGARPVIHMHTLTQRSGPLLVVDMGVPRNVEPSVIALPNVRVVTLDELLPRCAERSPGLADAERIVNDERERFLAWLARREVVRHSRRQRTRSFAAGSITSMSAEAVLS